MCKRLFLKSKGFFIRLLHFSMDNSEKNYFFNFFSTEIQQKVKGIHLIFCWISVVKKVEKWFFFRVANRKCGSRMKKPFDFRGSVPHIFSQKTFMIIWPHLILRYMLRSPRTTHSFVCRAIFEIHLIKWLQITAS